jgi:hypothetical protein
MNQGYLDHWPKRYTGVHILRRPGVNLAPWNIDNHLLTSDRAGVAVDGQPLIFFHYSGLVPDIEGAWRSFHGDRHKQLEFVKESIYGPYLAAVEGERRMLRRAYSIEGIGSVRTGADEPIGPDVPRFYATGAPDCRTSSERASRGMGILHRLLSMVARARTGNGRLPR